MNREYQYERSRVGVITKTAMMLTTRQVAKLTGETPKQLKAWRDEGLGNGPKWALLGESKTMYWKHNVESWMRQRDAQLMSVG